MALGLSSATVDDEGGKEEQRRQHLKDIENSMLTDALNLNVSEPFTTLLHEDPAEYYFTGTSYSHTDNSL